MYDSGTHPEQPYEIYDVIVIGAGIAGMYSAYLLRKHRPHWKIAVLEKEGRIGGRMGSDPFYGTNIQIGAGIGRKKKDLVLRRLLKEVHIPSHEFTNELSDKTTEPISVPDATKRLRAIYERAPGITAPGTTFETFARKHLGDADYERFIASSGYSDYERADLHETLYHYGMDDNRSGWTALSVPWNDLLLTLTHAVGISNIKLRHPVQQIVHFSPVTTHRPIAMRTESEPKYQVTSRAGAGKWITRKVIVATTVESIRKLLPLPSQQAKIYKTVQGQPFLRIYGKFDKQSTAIMQEHVAKHTLVAGNIHRIIPMNIDKGVYMIVYSDNEGATRLKRYTENTDENRRVLCHLLERAVGIPRDTLKLIAIKSYFWEIGTHYYEPLPLPIPTPTLTHAPAASASASVSVSEIEKAHTEFVKKLQHPMPNVWVVGEAVSRNQGWVEGALESVEKVCKEWMTASLHLSK